MTSPATTWAQLRLRPASQKKVVVNAWPYQKINPGWSIDPTYPATDGATIDNCETTAGWTLGGAAPALALDSSWKIDGTYSLALGKDAHATYVWSSYEKTGTPVDMTDKVFGFAINVPSLTNWMTAYGYCLTVRVGSDASNYYEFRFAKSELVVGAQFLFRYASDAANTIGTPVDTALDYVRVALYADTAGHTLSNVLFDTFAVASQFIYRNTTQWTPWHDQGYAELLKDGTALTEYATLGNLFAAAGEGWFADIPNGVLYLKFHTSGTWDTPMRHTITAGDPLSFSNDVTFTEEIAISGADVVPDPRLDELPVIKHSKSGQIYGVGLPDSVSFSLVNDDGALDDLYYKREWQGARVEVWIGGDDLPFSEYQLLFKGRVGDRAAWSHDALKISQIQDVRQSLLSKSLDAGTAPVGLEARWRNKPFPKYFGQRWDRTTTRCINKTYYLLNAMTAGATSFTLQNAGAGYSSFPTGDYTVVMIDSEKILCTARTGTAVPVYLRGYADTTAAAHLAGAEVTVISAAGATSLYPYLYFMPFVYNATSYITTLYHAGLIWTKANVLYSTGMGYSYGRINNITGPPYDPNDVGVFFPIDDSQQITVDLTDTSGDALGSIILALLQATGVPASDIDATSFTDVDALILDSQPGLIMRDGESYLDVLEIALRTAMCYIVVGSTGKLTLRRWAPVPVTTGVVEFTEADLLSWEPRIDVKDIRSKVCVKYARQFEVSDKDKQWKIIERSNVYADSFEAPEKALEIETCEYNAVYAAEIADHLSAVSIFPSERVVCSVAPFWGIELRPGDVVRLTVGRPFNSEPRIYEVESSEINIGGDGVSMTVTLCDFYGLRDRVAAITDDSAAAWSAATADEKIENCFISDADGLIDPTDADTYNGKVIY